MFGAFRVGPEFMALLGLEVELAPGPLAGRIDQAVGVAAIAVDVPIALGQAAIGEEDRQLVQAFRAQ